MKYKVIVVPAVTFVGTDFEGAAVRLAERVEAEMASGWKPVGGVAVGGTQSTHEPHLFQAMILE